MVESVAMDSTRSGLSEAELTSVAVAVGREPVDLAAELEKRPWAIHDLLSDPDLVTSVLCADELDPVDSPSSTSNRSRSSSRRPAACSSSPVC